MRKISLNEINKNIDLNRKRVNEELKKERKLFSRMITIKRRRRSADEIQALTEVTRASIKNAEKEGKFIIKGKRKIYYDPPS